MVRTWWAWCRHGLEMRLTGKTWFGHSCDAKLILGPEPGGEMVWIFLCTCFYFCTCFCFAGPLKWNLWGFMNWDPLFLELWNGTLEESWNGTLWSLSYEMGPSGLKLRNGTLEVVLELWNGTLWSWLDMVWKWFDTIIDIDMVMNWMFCSCWYGLMICCDDKDFVRIDGDDKAWCFRVGTWRCGHEKRVL